MVFIVYTMGVVDDATNAQQKPVWAIQALMAAFVRITEIVYNAIVVKSLQRTLPWWQTAIFVLASIAIIFGRTWDTFVVSQTSFWVSIRTGMAIVSIAGVVASGPIIFIFAREIYRLTKSDAFLHSKSKGTLLLEQAGTRLLFLNLIDLGLVFIFLIPNTPANPFVRWFFDNWDNSRLAYYAADMMLSKTSIAVANERTRQESSINKTSRSAATHLKSAKPVLSVKGTTEDSEDV
ncbi:uncharacterized protein EV422DRAFT_528744 [Fimicolochytrium jonesii]|uniref:uncharacterized protein n=1 Tax=Fimicolochytrium jonesii TaxID=1396493 RepID=UPI0022FE43A3|nr:uncharacterized protein EV422DRAFT_528744 [Fimicolochytrium jonesii]KAI8821019.1 hypothetical protein EV422DRAFT_528744 [Fimicolochytrium jonesii]